MAEVISRRSIVYDILFEVEKGKKSAKQAQQELQKLDKQAQNTGNSFRKLTGAITAAFAIEEVTRQVIQFTKESIKLAQQAEGVKRAFAALNNPQLLDELRKATRGTVSDLQLMQASVRAQNFKIPLQQLATYFDFAARRARDTGQSVDYLVNSIIDGIGRKSTLVLDNLGLSAVQIQKEFGKTGDLAKAVSNIIKVELGDQSSRAIDSAANSIEAYQAAIENLKTEIGEKLIPVLGKAADLLLKIFKQGPDIEENQRSTLEFLGDFTDELSTLRNEERNAIVDSDEFFQKQIIGAAKLSRATGEPLKNIISLGLEYGKIQSFEFTDLGDELRLLAKETEVANEAAANFLQTLTPEELDKLSLSVEDMERAMANLQDTQKGLNIITQEGRDEYLRLQGLIDQIKEDIESLTRIQVDGSTEILEVLDAELIKREEIDTQIKTAIEEQKIGYEELAEIQRRVRLDTIAENAEAAQQYLEGIQNIGNAVNSLFEQGTAAAKAGALISILAEQAKAIAGVISLAARGSFTPIDYFVNLTALLASVTAGIAQAKNILSQANAIKAPAVTAFAEGEVDIHRPGEKRGKDSIPAMIMPGESVMTTEETQRYKPVLEAIRAGTLDDLIQQNYIEPSLALNALDHAKSDSTELDYSEKFYRQLLATGEGNGINKRALRHLQSIDKKLSVGIPKKYS